MSASGIAIRDESPDDAAAIEAVTIAAFLDAPHADHTEHHVVRALRDSGRLSLSLVAEDDGAVVGHVAISPVTIADGAERWFGVGPVSVTPAYQARGIGSKLMTEALRRLRENGANGCVVLGDPAFYGRFGVRADAGLVLADVPPEYFQAVSFTKRMATGIVTYDETFSASERNEPDAGAGQSAARNGQ